jgi:hypothetical protein
MRLTPAGWVEEQVLQASGGGLGFHDEFGSDIALDGNRALIQSDHATYVFARAGETWLEEFAIPPGAYSYPGKGIDLEGETAVLGRPQAAGGGAVEFWGPATKGWVMTGALPAPADAASFGTSVDLEGERLIVGDPTRRVDGHWAAGAAFVYRRSGDGWVLEDTLLAPVPAAIDQFGLTVQLAGNLAIVGAPYADEGAVSTGGVHVFRREGTAWSRLAALGAGDGGETWQLGRTLAFDRAGGFAGARGPERGRVLRFALAGPDLDGAGGIDACQALSADVVELSVPAGGTQSLEVRAGEEHAGALYLVLGTASGSGPGVEVGGVQVPLNPDGYTTFTLTTPNRPPLVASLGLLGAGGSVSPSWSVPAGALPPSLAGATLHHACLVLGPEGQLLLATNPWPLALTP